MTSTLAARHRPLPPPPGRVGLLAALRGALALLSPVDCAGCGWPDIELCAECRAKLRPALLTTSLAGGVPLVSGTAYGGVVRDVVLAFKQQGRWRLARELGPVLRAALAAAAAGAPGGGAPPVLLVGVPPSRAGLRRRGYDPVELLVRAAGGRLSQGGLRILRSSGSQKTRTRSQRLAARHGTLRGAPWLAGRSVVLVDDVVTSGSTLVEAVRAVHVAGGIVVGACCLAATPLMSEAKP